MTGQRRSELMVTGTFLFDAVSKQHPARRWLKGAAPRTWPPLRRWRAMQHSAAERLPGVVCKHWKSAAGSPVEQARRAAAAGLAAQLLAWPSWTQAVWNWPSSQAWAPCCSRHWTLHSSVLYCPTLLCCLRQPAGGSLKPLQPARPSAQSEASAEQRQQPAAQLPNALERFEGWPQQPPSSSPAAEASPPSCGVGSCCWNQQYTEPRPCTFAPAPPEKSARVAQTGRRFRPPWRHVRPLPEHLGNAAASVCTPLIAAHFVVTSCPSMQHRWYPRRHLHRPPWTKGSDSLPAWFGPPRQRLHCLQHRLAQQIQSCPISSPTQNASPEACAAATHRGKHPGHHSTTPCFASSCCRGPRCCSVWLRLQLQPPPRQRQQRRRRGQHSPTPRKRCQGLLAVRPAPRYRQVQQPCRCRRQTHPSHLWPRLRQETSQPHPLVVKSCHHCTLGRLYLRLRKGIPGGHMSICLRRGTGP